MTITGQTSISLSGESSGLTLMMAVSPVLDWLRLFLIMDVYEFYKILDHTYYVTLLLIFEILLFLYLYHNL